MGESFASLLRSHRLERGLTQEALAERAGLGVRTIQGLEDGTHRPQKGTIAYLANALALGAEERRAFENAGLPSPRRRGDDVDMVLKDKPAQKKRQHVTRHNLGAELTSFIGRTEEMREIGQLLTRTRLVTLTGAGGCGKTRLALQIAGNLVEEYPDGVWLVELAPLADPRLVAQAVAAVLRVPEAVGQDLVSVVIERLRARTLLLIFDNCEHLLDACARFADALLRACPQLRILATSRETLRIAGEVSWRVPSLTVPKADRDVPMEVIAASEAVQLFVDRAAAVSPGFAITPENARAVVDICRQLDGIPLAIELAAARLPGIPIHEIAARLDQRFHLLRGGNRAALPRHQTLAALVDWSYRLLDDAERRLFDRLAVFVGGFTLEAVEEVCAGDAIDRADVLDLLARLMEKSLIMADDDGPGQRRYRLLETLRQFAHEKLAKRPDLRAVSDRHTAYYCCLAEAFVESAAATMWMPTLQPVEGELGNLRAAVRWAVEAGNAERALHVCGDLWMFWLQRGYLAEERAWLAELLASPAAAKRTTGRARALSAAAVLAWYQGDDSAARLLLDEALSIQRASGDLAGLVTSLINAGWVETGREEWAGARAHLQEALPLARELAQPILLYRCLYFLSHVAYGEGDYALAAALQHESIATMPLSSPYAVASNLNWLGHIATARGDYRQARAHYKESVARRRLMEFPVGMAVTLFGCASLVAAQGQHARAARLAGAAGRLCEDAGVSAIRGQEAGTTERLEASRRVIGSDAFDAAWAEGQAMTLEQAVAYALEEDGTRYGLLSTDY